MRKAIIAAIVATALFAVGAFAASFAVSSSDVASGSDAVGSCANEATVEFETNPAYSGTDFTVTGVTVTFLDANSFVETDCDGGSADLAIGSQARDIDGIPIDPMFWTQLDSDPEVLNGIATFSVSNLPVGPIEKVAVLVNGNAVPTPDFPG